MKESTAYKIVIREDPNHFSPIGVDWWSGFVALGHSASLVLDNRALFHQSKDIDVFVNMMSITDIDVTFFIESLRAHNPKCKIISTVTGPLEKLEPYLGKVDVWFDCGYSHPVYQEWFGKRGQVFMSILEATNETKFYKGLADDEYTRDFSFIGQFGERGHGYRGEDKFLYPLIDDPKLTHYLFGFQYKSIGLQHVDYCEVNTIFNCSKINLNFHYPSQKFAKIVLNKRTFDIAASGNFQLNDNPLYEQLLGVRAYPHPDDYICAFYYYLDRPEERAKIVSIAQKRVLEEHTWTIRMKNLLHDIYNL